MYFWHWDRFFSWYFGFLLSVSFHNCSILVLHSRRGLTTAVMMINIQILDNIGMWGYGLDRAGSVQEQVAGTCQFGNESSRSIKCREFLE